MRFEGEVTREVSNERGIRKREERREGEKGEGRREKRRREGEKERRREGGRGVQSLDSQSTKMLRIGGNTPPIDT